MKGISENSVFSAHELSNTAQAASKGYTTFAQQRFMTGKDTSFSAKRFSAERNRIRERIFEIKAEIDFQELALEIYRYQFSENPTYRTWSNALNRNPSNVHALEDIPFLPIHFFKGHEVKSGSAEAELVFSSSGTTGALTSRHYIYDASLYRESILRGFKQAYGNPEAYCIIGLLPAYLERPGSSLVWMTELLIQESKHPDSGFYLYNLDELKDMLHKQEAGHQKIWLIGVSFALIDFSMAYPSVPTSIYVIETGGMKGRRREMIREELHAMIKSGWPLRRIDSEYGMTELLSQAWMLDEKHFNCPPWMKVLIRESDNPLAYEANGKTGGINVIDLANLDSCAFIETADLGRIVPDKGFEVLGRFDHADVRGCNLMMA